MKINGVSIQGIFVYDQGNITYEIGDIVLYNNSIYIYSKSDDVLSDGKTPDKSKDFTPYLADKITSLEEWKSFLDEKSEDKYITTNTLVAILNYYMTDLRLDGIIDTGYSLKEGEDSTGDWVLDEYLLDSSVGGNTAIDEILRSSSNYAIYRVSRKTEGMWMVDYDTSKVVGNYTDEDRNSVLVKQYTYYASEKEKQENIQTRIQEIIDYLDGTVYYRYAKYDPMLEVDGTIGNLSSISDWHNTRISKNYEYQITSIINSYAAKIKELEILKNSLKRNFKFKEIGSGAGESSVKGRTSVILSPVPISGEAGCINIGKNLSEIGPVTVLVERIMITDQIYHKTYETSIEFDEAGGGGGVKYYLDKGVYLTVNSIQQGGAYKITTSSDEVKIRSIYYREFY